MKKFDISLFAKNNDGIMEEDIRVRTNSKKYLFKKLREQMWDDSGSIYVKYYYGFYLYDNKTKESFRYLAELEYYIETKIEKIH